MAKQKRKCKAKLLGIIHEYVHLYVQSNEPLPEEYQKIIEEFERHIVKGKTLYIERSDVRKKPPNEIVVLYDILINQALASGMKVVSLQSKRTESMQEKLDKLKWETVREVTQRIGMSQQQFLSTASIYGISPLRERGWASKLESAQKGDIVVMFPAHAYRIAPLIGIDRKKIFYLSRTEEDAKGFWRKELHWRRIKKFNEVRKILREQRRHKKP